VEEDMQIATEANNSQRNLKGIQSAPKVIPKSQLKGITAMDVEGQETYLGEVRHFKSHDYLAEVLPKNLSIAWTQMPANKELLAHFHPCASMLLVCNGLGSTTGDTITDVKNGDIVYIPEWNLHGFQGKGAQGFTALSIQFQETAIFSSEETPETSYMDRESIPLEDRQLKIIGRDSLESLSSVKVDGESKNLGVLKNFAQNEYLKSITPDYFSAAWVHLKPGEVLEDHTHTTDSMIIITQGSGLVSGDTQGALNEGDIVYVPAGCEHGFTGAGAEGFWALSVQFQENSLYENPDRPQVSFVAKNKGGMSFEQFVQLNNKYSSEFLKNPIFDTSIKNALSLKYKKEKLLDCLQVMSDSFQRLMFSRMALCDSIQYKKIFFEHFMEELGHDLDLQKERNRKDKIWDPILEATTFWFFGKNFLIDDPARIVMTQMVLEGGAHMFYSHFSKILDKGMSSDHITKHSVADEGHDSMGVELLATENAQKLTELSDLMEKSWDMLNEFLARTAQLIHEA
tara:strand:+ start:42 stop:1580 length:1539 start_codon:yes stop_codon:yes gene_type:complete